MSMQKKKLVDICNPKQWKTIAINELKPDGYPVYGANGKIGFYDKYTHSKETILVTCRGATCGTINICEPYSYVTGNSMALDDLDETRVDLKFLGYQLKARGFSDVISGSAQPQITRQGLSKVEVIVPDIFTQREIASKIEKVDFLLEKRRQSLAKLDQLAQSIFLDMFGDPVTNPKNWPIQKLSDYEEFLTSGSRGWAEYYSDSGALFIRIQNVKGTQLHLSDVAYVAPPDSAESRRTKVRPRDLLISITADLGRTCVIPNDIGDAYINQHLALMRLKGVNPFYIANFIESYAGKSQLMRMNREGVKAALNFSDIRSLEIPVPPINKQNDFERVVGQVFVLKQSYLKSLGQLQNLQQSLSQKFFGV